MARSGLRSGTPPRWEPAGKTDSDHRGNDGKAAARVTWCGETGRPATPSRCGRGKRFEGRPRLREWRGNSESRWIEPTSCGGSNVATAKVGPPHPVGSFGTWPAGRGDRSTPDIAPGWRHPGAVGGDTFGARSGVLGWETTAFGSGASRPLDPSSGDGGTDRSCRGTAARKGRRGTGMAGSGKDVPAHCVLVRCAEAHVRGLQPGEPHGRQQGETDLQGVRGANRRSREKRHGRNGTDGVATGSRRHAVKS